MENEKDIEYMFNQEVIEKKRVARGINNRASRKRGIKGAVKFPSDFLKGKDKKLYCGPGEVRCYTMIPEYSDFKDNLTEDKTAILAKLLSEHSRHQIAQAWGVTSSTVNNWVWRLGMTTKQGAHIGRKKKEPTQDFDHQEVVAEVEQVRTVASESHKFVFKLEIEGNKKYLLDRLNKMMAFLEESDYKLEVIASKREVK